ncbi:hypothetical protein, partial [Streptomyces sp. A 4/2]|uniref:hypothetical protein n=1 Tax=Streptomyces sp. A 4/2 TaxID=2934314 RepID=UPI0035AB7D0D
PYRHPRGAPTTTPPPTTAATHHAPYHHRRGHPHGAHLRHALMTSGETLHPSPALVRSRTPTAPEEHTV